MERRRYVIVMAAGSGLRMGTSLPKQFLQIGGKAVLQHTIETFLEASPGISVVTVLNPDYVQYWREYCLKHNFTCPQIIVAGGITRFHSVRNALDKIPEGAIVAVHDGVRPLVTVPLVKEMFGKAEEIPALIPVVPCVDTLKVLRKDGDELRTIEGAVADRSVLYAAQTPQVTDDASVVQKYGKSLSYIMGERLNIKITTQEDLLLAKAVMSLRDND